jgi:hypothetical protein
MNSFVGHETVLFDYMREHGIPVYHKSNLFVRDVQAAVRGYMREKENEDIGTLEIDRLAAEFITDLEKRGIIVPFGSNTYILHLESYQLQPAKVEESAETAETSVTT